MNNYYKIEDRLDPGNYKVRVISINSVGHSKYAQGIFVLTPEPETVPSMVTAMKLEDLDDGLFIISWDAQEAAHFYNLTIDVQGAPGIENYPRIYNDSYITLSSIDGRIIYKLNKDLIINDYKDQGLTSLEPLPEAGTYRIRVYANNSLGRGPAQKGSKRLYIGCQNNNHVDNYCL
ncbi:MAG: hypothetical protein OXU45_03355 [Candidatus Melainabacteria bacterium]|nr:hypothetical protein [Candidatus Melainabacteria bacterium]